QGRLVLGGAGEQRPRSGRAGAEPTVADWIIGPGNRGHGVAEGEECRFDVVRLLGLWRQVLRTGDVDVPAAVGEEDPGGFRRATRCDDDGQSEKDADQYAPHALSNVRRLRAWLSEPRGFDPDDGPPRVPRRPARIRVRLGPAGGRRGRGAQGGLRRADDA